jgi:hypothetical protein
MKIRLFFIITLTIISLNSGLAQAQSSITNNSGTSGLYSISGTSYYQNPSSQQQQTVNINQAAGGLVLQDQISGIVIDPTSAPPFSTTAKSNETYKIFAYLAVLLVFIGGIIIFFGLIKQQPHGTKTKDILKTPKEPKPEPEVEDKAEPAPPEDGNPKELDTKTEPSEKVDKPQKSRKNKKHHR